MHKVRKLTTTFIEYLLLIFVILECNTVYAKNVNTDLRIPEITALLAIVLAFIELPASKMSWGLLKKYARLFGLYYIATVLYMLTRVKTEVMLNYVARFIVFFPLITLIMYVKHQKNELFQFMIMFSGLMSLLAAASLFFWIFGSQLHLITPTGNILVSWGGEYLYPSYYGIYVERQRAIFLSYNGMRNQSIFCEAPMFSLCLTIAIAVELFFPNDNIRHRKKARFRISDKHISLNVNGRFWRFLFLTAALLTTFTTTGYVLLILILVMRFVLSRPRSVAIRIVKYLSVGFIVILGGATALWIYSMKASSASWATRVDDFKAGFKAWSASPLLGAGYTVNSAEQYMSSFRGANLGFSNAIFQVLTQGGLLLLSIYLTGLLGGIIKALKTRQYSVAAFSVVFALEFIFTIFGFTFMMLFMLAFEYTIILSQKSVTKSYAYIYNGSSTP